MIMRMKKVTLFAPESEREEMLLRLRSLGAVHIKNLEPPSSTMLARMNESLSDIGNAVNVLGRYKGDYTSLEMESWDPSQIESIARDILRLAREEEEAKKTLSELKKEMDLFKPWGGFEPRDLTAFGDKGIFIKLYRAGTGALRKLRGRDDVHLISRGKGSVYLALICGRPDEALPFEEMKFFGEGFKELRGRRETLKTHLEEIRLTLKTKARGADSLKKYLPILKKRHEFLEVAYGASNQEGFLCLQGYAPVDRVKDITALANARGLGYLVEDPNDPNDTPTLIKNPRWISIIRPVFKFMNTVPGYNEFDISLVFLIFFSLFFAMLIGDAGYGLLFLALTFLAGKKFKGAPREPFLLMYTLSVATVIWGGLTGTWFGAERIAQAAFLQPLVISEIDSFAGTNQAFMIYVCFVIGALHLSIAHLMNALKIINTRAALAEMGWISVIWGLFFVACMLVINRPFPQFAWALLAVGLAFIVAANPRSLANPLKVISSFADVVSYLRLFAVGYASVVLASTFNDLAMELGFNSVIAGLGSALILFLGHTLNIALGAMSVIVHGIRLNMLEFSGQMNMEWSGKEYNPFREKEAAT